MCRNEGLAAPPVVLHPFRSAQSLLLCLPPVSRVLREFWVNQRMVRVLAAILLFVVAAGCKKPARSLGATVPADFVSHTAGSISLKTPPLWTEQSSAVTGQVILYVLADDGVSSVNIVKLPGTPPSRDPDAVAKEAEKSVGPHLKNYHLRTAESILVAGEDSPRIIYEGDMASGSVRLQQTMVVSGGNTYIVTFRATPSNYDKLAPTVDQILESVQIK
jgi:hypothetical protein